MKKLKIGYYLWRLALILVLAYLGGYLITTFLEVI